MYLINDLALRTYAPDKSALANVYVIHTCTCALVHVTTCTYMYMCHRLELIVILKRQESFKKLSQLLRDSSNRLNKTRAEFISHSECQKLGLTVCPRHAARSTVTSKIPRIPQLVRHSTSPASKFTRKKQLSITGLIFPELPRSPSLSLCGSFRTCHHSHPTRPVDSVSHRKLAAKLPATSR